MKNIIFITIVTILIVTIFLIFLYCKFWFLSDKYANNTDNSDILGIINNCSVQVTDYKSKTMIDRTRSSIIAFHINKTQIEKIITCLKLEKLPPDDIALVQIEVIKDKVDKYDEYKDFSVINNVEFYRSKRRSIYYKKNGVFEDFILFHNTKTNQILIYYSYAYG